MERAHKDSFKIQSSVRHYLRGQLPSLPPLPAPARHCTVYKCHCIYRNDFKNPALGSRVLQQRELHLIEIIILGSCSFLFLPQVSSSALCGEQAGGCTQATLTGDKPSSENHRLVEVGRDLWRPSAPTPLLQQGHLQLVAHSHVQMAFEYFQGWRSHCPESEEREGLRFLGKKSWCLVM